MSVLQSLAPFDRGFNAAVFAIAERLMPQGYDVGPDAPDDYDSMMAHWAKTGRVKVFDGQDDRNQFGDAEAYYAFRAWHDFRHITTEGAFTPGGEWKVVREQHRDIFKMFGIGRTAQRYKALTEAGIVALTAFSYGHGGRFPNADELRTVIGRDLFNRYDLRELGLTLPADVVLSPEEVAA